VKYQFVQYKNGPKTGGCKGNVKERFDRVVSINENLNS
jgi:hypothetical protein